ncbi:hypothetical protein [Pseudomonas asplenii]|uniref:hypothetical protein n=1 Tax=Pseudomonas asplenii TaxID=53407 RepID=UPI00235E1D42|nr:hypothetical protein [Pseudomonas asplenii]
MNDGRYPRLKIFMIFLFCPLFVGVAVAPVIFISMLIDLVTKPNLMGEVRGAENFMVLVVVPLILEALLFFPFMVLALYLVIKKIKKNRRVVLTAAIFGGGLSVVWLRFLIFVVSDYGKKPLFVDNGVFLIGAFFVMALGAGLAAFWFLPGKLHGSFWKEE